jgi:FAD/FMN-containing dehydrogenase
MGKRYPETRGYLHAYFHITRDLWLLLYLPSYGDDRHGYCKVPLGREDANSDSPSRTMLRVVTDDADLERLSTDSGMLRLRPRVAYVVETEVEAAAAVRQAMSDGLSITPRGAGTSIPDQSVGKGAILLQERQGMELQSGGAVKCQPALIKSELNKLLSPFNLWMPVDPSSYASCTIGGMVANNASGVRTPKYGSTIDYVESLRAVLIGDDAKAIVPIPLVEALSADARTRKAASLILENRKVIEAERPKVTKNSSGYRLERVLHDGIFDLPKLFVGSEGTLGVLTEATFTTKTRPSWRLLFIVESSLEELNQTVGAFRELGPTALELVDKSIFRAMKKEDRIAKYSRSERDYLVFCEFDGVETKAASKLEEVAASKAANYDPIVLSSAAEVSDAWEVRNQSLTLALEIRKGTRVLLPGVEDLVVPPGRLAELIKLLMNEFGRRGLEYISYGHAGDANLHARPLLDPNDRGDRQVLDDIMEDCFEAVWKMGGSITGEHGDGMLRAKYVERQYPKTYWIMKEIKSLYDPKRILNPGVKVY